MPTAHRAVLRKCLSSSHTEPDRRKKRSLADDRADYLAKARRSTLHARVTLAAILQLGIKSTSRWEVALLVLIRAKSVFNKKRGQTEPWTKREIAAQLGCSQRTADRTISRLLEDKLIGRRRVEGKYGWGYFTSDVMLDKAPEQADEDTDDDVEIESIRAAEEKAKESEHCSLESAGSKESMRQVWRILSSPKPLFSGVESESVPVPEEVHIRSVRVAETADSDVSLSWSDAVIDDDGQITVWVHGCRKKPAPPAAAAPKSPSPSDLEELEKLFAARLGRRLAAREFPLQLPSINTGLAGAPVAGFTRWLADVKLPEKDAKGYTVQAPLFASLAEEYGVLWANDRDVREEYDARVAAFQSAEQDRIRNQARADLARPDVDPADRAMLLESWPELAAEFAADKVR